MERSKALLDLQPTINVLGWLAQAAIQERLSGLDANRRITTTHQLHQSIDGLGCEGPRQFADTALVLGSTSRVKAPPPATSRPLASRNTIFCTFKKILRA